MTQGILLAAGYGRRFDPAGNRDKLLEPLADGHALLWHSARHLCAALPGSIAVIRPDQSARRLALEDAGCRVLECAAAQDGIGTALAAAVGASRGADGWLVALGDMPWLPEDVICRVAAAIARPDTIAAPVHNGVRGHPVAFGAAWGDRLAALSGDRGARELLHGTALTLIDTTEAGVVRDVDRPADLSGRSG
ncbi:MAG: nucleotidyltransferase family protein [Azoarcus sp.]|nr:nucleotidyltransferase family protein [Azoarcus sp.]